ncbi:MULTISPECIES: PFL_4669 family integrating conjugative element protein [Pseudomonas]|uniref:PFL_4669 family integrating conjugative element protein n=1 Tax=Pseudomonas TaxID=286 RepID=UPI000CD5ADE4|nr:MULTISPECIES: TIGR03761 family integrating conjugative element protein [Pseudomonas]RBH55842.1 TIGR03761 family integrating conjugative element protein [Pseudomonas sp. MWU13-2860]
MSNPFPLSLGPLRSAMELTLHTHYAVRIWQGRPADQEKSSIISLNGFVSLVNKIKHGAEQDDPYADFWMIRIHEKLVHSKDALTLIRGQLDELMRCLPSAMQVGENFNVHPVTVPLYINTPLGFLAVYLLIDYDNIARQLLLANHTALMGRRDMERWINAGGHVLRSLFGLAQQFKFSGVTREDFAANNAAAREARERFGELPADVLEGTRRCEFAPQIIRRRVNDEGRLEAVEKEIEGGAEVEDAVGDGQVSSSAGLAEPAMGSERVGG